jgi:hypothetical protein
VAAVNVTLTLAIPIEGAVAETTALFCAFDDGSSALAAGGMLPTLSEATLAEGGRAARCVLPRSTPLGRSFVRLLPIRRRSDAPSLAADRLSILEAIFRDEAARARSNLAAPALLVITVPTVLGVVPASGAASGGAPLLVRLLPGTFDAPRLACVFGTARIHAVRLDDGSALCTAPPAAAVSAAACAGGAAGACANATSILLRVTAALGDEIVGEDGTLGAAAAAAGA